MLQLEQEAESGQWNSHVFGTVFFGGGTPSLFPPDVLIGLLSTSSKLLDFVQDSVEISIEVNPATIDEAGLQQLRQAGFNRLSIGIQSFRDDELQRLGRIHSRKEALGLIQSARKVGFENLSLDLMYGLPGQKPEAWKESLELALELRPEHLSMYELTIEPGTVFFTQAEKGQLHLPPEDDVLEMMAMSQACIRTSALKRYEISNYALAGRECRHNINYWQNGSYLGLGAGAVSCCKGKRSTAVTDLEIYCRRIEEKRKVWDDEEQLSTEAALRETVVMGLRMTTGVSLQGLLRRFKVDIADYYGPVLVRLVDQGLVTIEQEHLRLTDQGMLLANSVMAELV